MSLAGCRIDLNGLERCCFRSGESFRRRCKAVPGKSAVTVGQTRVGNPVIGLLVYGLLEIICSFLNSLCCSLVPKITPFEVSLICSRIDRADSCQAHLLLRSERSLDFAGNRSRDLTLQRQHILQFAVVAL